LVINNCKTFAKMSAQQTLECKHIFWSNSCKILE